ARDSVSYDGTAFDGDNTSRTQIGDADCAAVETGRVSNEGAVPQHISVGAGVADIADGPAGVAGGVEVVRESRVLDEQAAGGRARDRPAAPRRIVVEKAVSNRQARAGKIDVHPAGRVARQAALVAVKHNLVEN